MFPEKFTSQTALFLEVFRNRTIGITGTKGKSTTASLTHHLLTAAGKDALLIGNIGVPPFDVLDRIKDDTLIVFELRRINLRD
jgi:UDP-N-acetylmuramoyl-L-alanine---L-glutamate ligase